MVETPLADAVPHDKFHWPDATVRVYDLNDVTPEVLVELRERENAWLATRGRNE